MTVSKHTTENNEDCYTFQFKRLQMFFIIAAFIVGTILVPLGSALTAFVRIDMRMNTFVTREEAIINYISRRAAENLTAQRDAQMNAVNRNIVVIASNQDTLNGQINKLLGKLGIESSSTMAPIPFPSLPITHNPEPVLPK